jgi:hypothetical protein
MTYFPIPVDLAVLGFCGISLGGLGVARQAKNTQPRPPSKNSQKPKTATPPCVGGRSSRRQERRAMSEQATNDGSPSPHICSGDAHAESCSGRPAPPSPRCWPKFTP